MQIMDELEADCAEMKIDLLHETSPSSPYAESHKDQTSLPEDSTTSILLTSIPSIPKDEQNKIIDNDVKDEVMIVEFNCDANLKSIKEEKLDEKDEDEKREHNNDDIKCNEAAANNPNLENNKRKFETNEEDPEEETLVDIDESNITMKKFKSEEEKNFELRDRIINNFIEMSECNNIEQIQNCSEQVLNEIKCLHEMTKEKEKEWNQLLHMKKFKEELLLRLQRKRQMLIINDGELKEIQPEPANGQISLLKCNQKAALLKQINSVEKSKSIAHNRIHSTEGVATHNTIEYRHKQRPTLDVQRIIADYRLNHPETVPRRGRRIRQSQTTNGGGKANILGFSDGNFTIGQRIVVENNGDIVLSPFNHNNMDEMIKEPTSSTYRESQERSSYKEILDNLSKLSQKERTELQLYLQNFKPPPPYPEVTVHPVTSTSSVAPTNSLLHGILTKNSTNQSNQSNTNNVSMINHLHHDSKTSFSPTLARLLTAPERSINQINSTVSSALSSSENLIHSNLSISDIFCGNKARNEITITPVENQYDNHLKSPVIGEEVEDQSDRLIIDETTTSTETLNTFGGGGSGNASSDLHHSSAIRDNDNCSSENSDEVPQCQGCNQKPAQFVCAGCGDQWYCSRNCQIAAWDEHSEVCSG